MKPLNNNDPTCNPISSNCVIWQGPDIECIKLCKGDTVSDVVYKLALELCEVMDTLDISNYDLSCFNLPNCPPEDFQQLIQFLIERICALEDCCDQTSPTPVSGCPDCIVAIAPCFYFVNQFGDTVTSMQLQDYVTAIGNRLCSLSEQINTLNQTVQNQEIRIQALEEAVQTRSADALPLLTPECVLTPVPTDPLAVLQALELQFCQLRLATGMPNEILLALVANCLNGNPPAALSTSGPVTGWQPVQNLSNAINNMYQLICDLRAAVTTIQLNCCPGGCDGIEIQLQAAVSGNNLVLYFTGTIPGGFVYCGGNNPIVTVSDTGGNFFNQQIDIIGNLNAPGGISIPLAPTPVNPASDLTILITPCFYNASTNSTCQFQYIDQVTNNALCPTILFDSGTNSIDYSFNWAGVAASITVELYDGTGTVLIDSNTHGVLVPSAIVGTFTGLTVGTNYKIRVKITIGDPGVTTTCNWNIVATLPPPCVPPGNVMAQLVIP